MSGLSWEYSKYAIISESEVVFDEVILHAGDDRPVVVFKTADGSRRYATHDEWVSGSDRFATHAEANNIVTANSSNQSKAVLYRSLFRGREDVYAHGYPSKKGKPGKLGYTPSCKNENDWNVCPRKKTRNWKYSCADCAKREFNTLGYKELVAHFKGEKEDFTDVLGMFVLDENCMTHVLIADFDGEGWKKEISAYQREGALLGIDVAVERSRSGEGGHAWIFFDEPVDAGFARDLGSALLSSAMAKTPALNFKAYDRFFPAQSTIPKGGFGNLISLPLQGRAMQRGNSVFVDENFEMYPDQWRYLSGVTKVSREQAQRIIEQIEDGPLGTLSFAKKKAFPEGLQAAALAEGNAPSASPLPALPKELSPSDFPLVVSVVKSNMIYVSKEGLSTAAQNKIRRLAAFGNPEFYKAQALRQSVNKKPRIINLGEETGDYIAIPRGCESKLRALLAKVGVSYQVEDGRNAHSPIRVEFKGKLRDRQQIAADALLRHDYGVLSAPTGFGKTVIGAYLVSSLKMRTLVIVPDTALLSQWQEKIGVFLQIDEELPPLLTKKGNPSKKRRPLVGRIGGGKNAPSGIVDIATYQSLLEKGDIEGEPKSVKKVIQNYDLVICDECHHGAAPQLEKVLRAANARRVYGLSATPKREDGLENIIFMQCGPIRHKVTPQEQAAEQTFTRRMLPRFTRIRLKNLEPNVRYDQVLDQICQHEARNRLIVEDVMASLSQGRTPFVVTKLKSHAKLLAEKLENEGCEPFLLIGEGTNREKEERLHAVKSVSSDEKLVIVATGSYVGEGFDLPRLDTLFLASPFSSDRVITQYSGRLHREWDNKQEVVVCDYVDANVPMLERMYKKRLKCYAKLSYEVMSPDQSEDRLGGMIVTGADFQATFARDMETASKSICVAAPYANLKLLRMLEPTIKNAVERGVDVSVSIEKRRLDDSPDQRTQEAVRLLSVMGCKVRVVEGGHSCLAVIDGETVWYGSLPLLAFARKDECSLRFKSCEVAHDLMESEGLRSGPLSEQDCRARLC